MQGIAVLDAGGQYCHLLARRVREAGVQSHVLPIDTNADQLSGISGIIISGGPRSVTEAGSPRIDPSILSMGVPDPRDLLRPSAARRLDAGRSRQAKLFARVRIGEADSWCD